MENSNPIERSETTQGIAKINQDNCATFSGMEQEIFSVQNKKIFANEKISQWACTRRRTKEIKVNKGSITMTPDWLL